MPPILESLFVFFLGGWVGAYNCTRDLFMYGEFSLNDLGSYTIRNAVAHLGCLEGFGKGSESSAVWLRVFSLALQVP